MIRAIPIAFLLLPILGCNGGFLSDLVFQPDQTESEIGINQHAEDFFILRYMTYKGDHEVGGTLNEFSIRNLTNKPMKVEVIRLRQSFRGNDITTESSPVVYEGMSGSILIGNVPIEDRAIPPGEWKSFDFLTEEISEYTEGDKLDLNFEIKITAGSKEFHESYQFSKTLVRVPRAWM